MRLSLSLASGFAVLLTSAQSDVPSFMDGLQTGQGTFYSPGPDICGFNNTDADYVALVSSLVFDNYPGYDGVNLNPVCGRKVQVTYGPATVIVTVVGRCAGCALTNLNFSPAAFVKLAPFDVGRISPIFWAWF